MISPGTAICPVPASERQIAFAGANAAVTGTARAPSARKQGLSPTESMLILAVNRSAVHSLAGKGLPVYGALRSLARSATLHLASKSVLPPASVLFEVACVLQFRSEHS